MYHVRMEKLRRRAIIRTTIAGAAVMAVGAAGYMILEKMSFLNALYMTTITITTIGFKEVVPLSADGKIFTIFLAFAGVGTFFLAGTEVARVVLETNIKQLFGRNREMNMIKQLSEHVIVCGYGRVGRAVSDLLAAQDHAFVVVDNSEDGCAELEDRGFPFIQGDATRKTSLEAAGIDRASTFLACLGDDALDVFSILLARQLNPDIRIIAIAVDEDSIERLHLAGAEKVVNPYQLGGARLALFATKPAVMEFLEASLLGANLELELVEITVEEGSIFAGKTLAEAAVRRKYRIIVVALKQKGNLLFNPDADTRICVGDVLVALGPPEMLKAVADSAGKSQS